MCFFESVAELFISVRELKMRAPGPLVVRVPGGQALLFSSIGKIVLVRFHLSLLRGV
jgi:hypothetical protein